MLGFAVELVFIAVGIGLQVVGWRRHWWNSPLVGLFIAWGFIAVGWYLATIL